MKATHFALVALAAMTLVAGAGEFQNELNAPQKAVVLKLERQQWQALVTVCAAPAFYNSIGSVPLMLDDGTGTNAYVVEHDALAVKDLGGDAVAASAKLAQKYWKKAETAFVVSNYEQALWIVPSAAFMSAPILVNPDAVTLQALGVKRAIVVGDAKPGVAEVVNLLDKDAVWKYQLAQMNAKGKKCDYVIMTNPHDTDDTLNANVQWPYLSPAAGLLAAYRRALVQTGDFIGDRQAMHNLGGTLGDSADKAKYEATRAVIQKVKEASFAAEKFLADNNNPPHFLAMVGGAIELPQYICDIHTKYKFWNLQIDYVPSDTPYATMRMDVDYSRFVKPDLAVGRIMADNALDATVMLVRTFFRKEWLPGGRYAAMAPVGWEKSSVVFDGHRLNQPDEGGPSASPNEAFHPAGEVQTVFTGFGLKSEYTFPHDETKKTDERPLAPDLFASTSKYGFVQYVAHGDPPYLRIEAGRTGRDMKNYLATGPEFRKRLNFTAPTTAYIIGCNVGTIYAPFKTNDEFIPTSAVHAGAVSFMAPNKCQAICFWRYAPRGPGASQCIYFWENVLTKKLPVGQALTEAKWRAYGEWKDKQYEADRGQDSDNAIEIDAPSMILYGDPALQLVD